MENQRIYDLTRGPIMNRLLIVAIPIMGTQFMQMAYNLTDMFWLGKVGSDAVAASGSAGMYMWLSMAFLLFGRIGSEIGVSQRLGAGDEANAGRYSLAALFIAASLGLIVMVVMAGFPSLLISFFNIREAHVAESAASYLRIVAFGLPAAYISAAVSGIFTGAGNSKLPFYINAVGLTANMILDPLLILHFGMGIDGAAIATIAAQMIVGGLSLFMIRVGKNRPFHDFRFFKKPDITKIREIIKWSTPVSIESLLFTVLSMIISRFAAAFGADAIAVSRVGSQIESLSWLIGGGFGTAITAFVGQNFGAKTWSRIRKCFKISVAAMLVWGTVITLILYFLGGVLFSLFISEPEICEMGRQYLQILAFCQAFACLEAVASSVFRGIGETVPPSVTSITGNVLRIPLSYALSKTSLGLNGLWIGVTAGTILRGILIMTWYLIRQRSIPKEDALNEQTFINPL